MKKDVLTKYTVLALTILLIGLLYWGCSEDANPLPSKAHSKEWSNPASEDFHGKKVAEVGYDYCADCHGDDYSGGESKVSCYGCHETFPHPPEWMEMSDPLFHGVYLSSGDGKVEDCKNCHGDDYKGGSSDVSCYKCHDNYPHVSGWMSSSSDNFHGTYLNSGQGKTESCQGCHGVDYQGGTSGVSCNKCHSTYPHPDGWMTKNNDQFHGTFIINDDWKTTNCESCHGEDYTGGTSGISCYTCHATFPHTDGWNAEDNDQFHGKFVIDNEWNTQNCESCHGEDYSGGTSNVSCYTCHASFPHPAGWMTADDNQFHGTAVSDNAWNTENCESCHGADYMGGNSNVSCYTCHATFPHPSGWMSENDNQFHGKVVIDNEWNTESCETCHGEDYTGGSTGVSCYTCHGNFPHPSGWMAEGDSQFHGTAVSDNEWNTENCESCHGVDYTGGTSNVSCYTCHASFPHPTGWMAEDDAQFHGKAVSDNNWDTESCAGCHGEDYTGGSTGVSCYTCHANFPHTSAWTQVSSTDFHGNYIRQDGWSMNSCKTCHGEDYQGGTTGASCYTCHQGDAGPESCNVCHGNSEHINPPEDLNKNTATTAMGVGAHEKHLAQSFITCDMCHTIPATFDAAGHIDPAPAEVNEQWTWDRNAGTCATSCHGDQYVWNNF